MKPVSREHGVRRWILPSRRRFVIVSVSLVLIGFAIWATQRYWLGGVAEWAYWSNVARVDPRSAEGDAFQIPSFFTSPLAVGLPPERYLLDSKEWATPKAGEAIEALRRQFPRTNLTWTIPRLLGVLER
jgi:hypothetical protein